MNAAGSGEQRFIVIGADRETLEQAIEWAGLEGITVKDYPFKASYHPERSLVSQAGNYPSADDYEGEDPAAELADAALANHRDLESSQREREEWGTPEPLPPADVPSAMRRLADEAREAVAAAHIEAPIVPEAGTPLF